MLVSIRPITFKMTRTSQQSCFALTRRVLFLHRNVRLANIWQWAQDATRIGSLVNLDSPRGEDELKGLMLYNLARLHSTQENFEEVYSMIKRSYITHHVSRALPLLILEMPFP